jgi:hypothetical protein
MRLHHETEIPDALADAVRRAAAAMPATVADLGRLRRRYQRQRKRRVATASGLAAVCVGVAGAGMPLLLAGPGDRTGSVSSASSAPPVATRPAQRLLLWSPGYVATDDDGNRTGFMPGAGILEMLPDGRAQYHDVSGVDGHNAAVALPDGRIVLTGFVDLRPGAVRPDGPWVEGIEFRIVVLRADGSIESSRVIGADRDIIVLVGATGREAYLLRSGGLSAHDLATGTERLLLEAARIPRDPSGGLFGWKGIDIAGDRLAVALDPCVVEVVDIAAGAPVAHLVPSTVDCTILGDVYLSPDGSHIAVLYGIVSEDDRRPAEKRLAILEVATGAVRVDRPMIGSPVGLAWSDGRTVRVAELVVPEHFDRLYRTEELTTVEVVTVPVG